MGFQHVGKSFLGRLVAHKINWPFMDTDDLLETQYAKQFGYPLNVKEIYQKHKEAFFRNLEKACILQTDFLQNQVVSLGGGSLLCGKKVHEHLKKAKIRVYLRQDRSTVKNRLEKLRPAYLEDISFDEMYKQRSFLFLQNQDIIMDVKENSNEQIVAFLADLVGNGK